MNLTVLISGTLVIMVFSWFYSIRAKRYHGIPRFFSFESIFILILMNYRQWFDEPFSLIHVISWLFLFASGYTGLAGYLTLRKRGKAIESFENTTVLVSSGIYSLIRHPLYCSLFLLGSGIMLKEPGSVQLILGLVNMIALYITGRTEEQEMKARFGSQYSEYMKRTKMFIPAII